MQAIQSIQDIVYLAQQGETNWKQYGEVVVRTNGKDLLIFNYTEKAQYIGRWNFFEQVSRGLIINANTGEVVARAFDKIYNWMERKRHTEAALVRVAEKLDGSLGVLYRDEGIYKIATRGSFESYQAQWATQFLQAFDLSTLPNEYTLLFEIVYPANRIIVDYGKRQELILLGARNRFTGDYVPFEQVEAWAKEYGFPLPTIYEFNSVAELVSTLATLDASHEGFMAEFADGQRFKFKSERYKELQQALAGLTFKNILAAYQDGTIEQFRENTPDEFYDLLKSWEDEISTTFTNKQTQVLDAFDKAPMTDNRKEYAQWVMQYYPDLSGYLFPLKDGKELAPLIYKMEFSQRKDELVSGVE